MLKNKWISYNVQLLMLINKSNLRKRKFSCCHERYIEKDSKVSIGNSFNEIKFNICMT